MSRSNRRANRPAKLDAAPRRHGPAEHGFGRKQPDRQEDLDAATPSSPIVSAVVSGCAVTRMSVRPEDGAVLSLGGCVRLPAVNTVNEEAPGVFLVRFPTVDHVVAKACTHLIAPLAEGAKRGRIVLLADPPAELRFVEPSMSTFWLEAFTRGGVNVAGIGIVTKSTAVRVVLSAIGTALRLKNIEVATRACDSVEIAIDWGRRIAPPRAPK